MNKKTDRPNIVFVLTDDQGPGDLGCNGNPVVRTPNIDAFHEKSVRFTNFHVGPTCAPTRSGLMTGHYANSTGVWHTVGGRSLLRGNEVSIADVFAENGYATGLFGKWHLGENYPYRPQDRGFQEVVTHGGGGISQMPDWWQNDYFDDTYMVNGEPRRFDGYCTDVWFRESMKFIETHKDEPFMCFITPNAPHAPYNIDPAYHAPYRGKAHSEDCERFYGMITNIDENFGRLEARLADLGLADNTIVIFMTDNGTSAGIARDADDFTAAGYNAGLRGGKGSPYDGGHRVPFFIRWPNGSFVAPQDIDTLTAFVDFMPTMMDLCGIDPARYAPLNFHGQSMKPLLTQPDPDWPRRAITTDSQRVPNPVKWRQSAVMTQEWRLVNGRELYDAANDREQRHDISADHPDVMSRLRSEYETWWKLVSTRFDDEIPISIGAPDEPETCLHSHDWRHPDNPHFDNPDHVVEDNSYLAFQQGQIRLGGGKNGYLEIMVEQDGTYRFELRRWPREEDRAIVEGIPPSDDGWRRDAVPENRWFYYTGGAAMSFEQATLSINGRQWEKPVAPDDKAVVFDVALKKGPAHLVTTFHGDNGLERGAYYVYVRKD
ncbi:MAG: arylsulfatase [Lentisphaerae bacterium]|nr:arylsulfatase [Lentisphaerota bacterium]